MAKAKSKAPIVAAAPADEITSYKGFNRDLTCRGFQFEAGKTFELTGPIKACSYGFHACEHPLNCFDYYAPATSRYFEVKQSGQISRNGDDTKVASARITIGVELSIGDMVQRAINWVTSRSKPEGETATGYQGAASATGDQGAASATGVRGAASATGHRGAASATGEHAVACALGLEGKAMAGETGAVMLVSRDPDTGAIRHVFAAKVGERGIKPNVFYALSDAGEPVEVL